MSRIRPGLWLPCAAVAFAAGILLGRACASIWFGAAAALLLLTVSLLVRGRIRFACILATVTACGCMAGYLAYHPQTPPEGTYLVTGVVCDEVQHRADGQIKTRLTDATLDGVPAPSDLYWSYYDEILPEGLTPGVQVTFTAEIYLPAGAENPGGFNFREHLLGQGIVCAAYGGQGLTITRPETFSLHGVVAALRHTLLEALTDAMGEEAGAYAGAMLLGTKARIPDQAQDAFSQVGAAHILAVSGFHVGVLAQLVFVLLRWCSLRIRTVITGIVLLAYCLLTGAHAPVIRAAALLCLMGIGRMSRRQVHGLWTLSLAFILALLYNPAQLTSASFLLSYGAVLGIVLVTPCIRRWKAFPNRRAQAAWEAFSVSLGAQLGVLVPQLMIFHELPLAGLLINLLLLPYASVLITLYWATLLLLPVPLLGNIAGEVSGLMTRWLLAAVNGMDALGIGALWTGQGNLLTAIGWACLMLALCFVTSGCKKLRRRILIAGLACMVLSFAKSPYTGAAYIQLSVGSEDAAILRDGETVVAVDTGTDGLTLAEHLHRSRMEIDYLFITHLHEDHAGGIAALLEERIPVGVCILPWGAMQTDVEPAMAELIDRLEKTGAEIRYAGRGDTIPLPNGGITVLWPEVGRVRPGNEANESSLALLAEIRGSSMLLMGDVDGIYEHYVQLPADILKAAHHGSAGETGEDFLAAVEPQAVIVSCGRDGVDDALKERIGATPLYTTEELGAITVTFGEGTFTISGTLR